MEGSHVTIGVELAKKYRESEGVIHAIHAHHNDVAVSYTQLDVYKRQFWACSTTSGWAAPSPAGR